MQAIFDSVKNEARQSIRLMPYSKFSKKQAYEEFLKYLLRYVFVEHKGKFADLSTMFEIYGVFLQYLLSGDEPKNPVEGTMDVRIHEMFSSLLWTTDFLLSAILSCQHGVFNVENPAENHFLFTLNESLVDRQKYLYTSMMLYPQNEDGLKKLGEKMNKGCDEGAARVIVMDLVDEMVKFDKKFLNVITDKSHHTVGDILEVYKLTIGLGLRHGFKTYHKSLYNMFDEDEAFNDLIHNREQFIDAIIIAAKIRGRTFRRKFVEDIIDKMGYQLSDVIEIDKIREIDFKNRPLIFDDNKIYLPHLFFLIFNPDRNFLSFMNENYKSVFNDSDKNKLGSIIADSLVEKLQKKFETIKNGDLVLQKGLNRSIRNSDIDFSIFDKESGTLMVFESKNFIPTHSLFDSFQKDLKKDSPIQKGIHTQLSGKIIPFLKDASEKELISLYGESIKIKKIYGFVLTSGFIGIQKNPFENIRVISLDHTLEILDKEPVGKLFSDIDVLANYDYYLSVLHAGKMETMPPMSLPVLLEGNKAKEYTFQCPVFMMPELSH